jgi:hypothetical protein
MIYLFEFNKFNESNDCSKDFSVDNIEKSKDCFLEEYIEYYGNDEGFESLWEKILRKFPLGGFRDIRNEISLSRLITTKSISTKNNIHWIRTSDEDLFYDNNWLFLVDTQINSDTKIIRRIFNKNEIDWYTSIIQNLTFPSEKEITVNDDLILNNYQIIPYKK